VTSPGALRIEESRYLFRGAPPPACLDAADADDSGRLNISDAIFVLIHEFLGGPGPGDLLPGCSIDPVVDGLDCQEYTGCG
jgi:hypothetical protein